MSVRYITMCALATAGLMFAGVSTASASTETTVEEHVVETVVASLPPSCDDTGPLYTITTTATVLVHVSTSDSGAVLHDAHATTGTFIAEPLEDPGLPSYTGTFVARGGFNQNVGGTATAGFVYTIRGTGSDGSHFVQTVVGHDNVRPDGTVNDVWQCHT